MRQFLENVTGLSIYPLFSFVLFGLFFLGVLVWMFTRSRAYYHEVSHIPLIDAQSDQAPPTPTNV